MSHTVDSPLKTVIPGATFKSKDKLLKLAESSGNSKGKDESGKKSKKKGAKYKSADSSFDLAFTSNIEHLALREHSISQRSSTPIDSSLLSDQSSNNSSHLHNTSMTSSASPPNTKYHHNQHHDINLNLSCDSPSSSASSSTLPCECIAHTTSLLDTISPSAELLQRQFSEVLNLAGETTQSFISPSSGADSFDLFSKSRIPQSVDRKRLAEFNRVRSLNRWPDTDDLSKQQQQQQATNIRQQILFSALGDSPTSSDNFTSTTNNKTDIISTISSTSNTSSRLTNPSNSQTHSHIPVYKQQSSPVSKLSSAPSSGNSSQLPGGGRQQHNTNNNNIVYYEKPRNSFFRTNSFISYLTDYNRQYNAQSLGTTSTSSNKMCNPDRNSGATKWYDNQATISSLSGSRLPQSQTSQAISSHLTQARLQMLNNQHQQEQQQTYQKMVKSRSHNFLQRKSSNQSSTSSAFNSSEEAVYFPQPASQIQPPNAEHRRGHFPQFFDYFGFDELQQRQPESEMTAANLNSAVRQNKPNAISRLDSFFVIDEDQPSFINSPKRIETTSSRGRSQHPSSLLISTPNQAANDSVFLRESQKNALTTITSESAVPAEGTSSKTSKSNSCESLDYLHHRNLTKPKSETDLSDAKNDLKRILHLEEVETENDAPAAVEEEESVLNRFRKSFSLRFSKHWNTKAASTEEEPTFSKNLASPTTQLASTDQSSSSSGFSSSISHHQQYHFQQASSDIHQNRIFSGQASSTATENSNINNSSSSGNSSFSNTVGKMSTIERRKSRADMFNRKSFRRSTTTRKSALGNRLKRSHSQPHDNNGVISSDLQQLSPTDRSVDSDFDGTKSPSSVYSQADTARSGGSELNDSQEANDEVIYAEAIWDYLTSDNEELNFRNGDLINVTDTSHKEWWWGAIKGQGKDQETRYGWFPASYVRLKVSQTETLEEALEAELDDGGDENADNNNSIATSITSTTPSNQQDLITSSIHSESSSTPIKKRMSMSTKMSSEQVRANVVLEIVNTERDFVKNLKDVIDGYLKPCRDRTDMFDETRVATIFGNIEELYAFQKGFLDQLEAALNPDSLASSEIGAVFLANESGFSVYGEFCTNHPLAISELQDLYTDTRYIVFFEGCRLLQNMIDISLDGFLLTPIQKICKYPLQLGELLKYTRTEHADHGPVSAAYACMQRVAASVNERKRRFEALEQLISLQEAFAEGSWEGPSLLDSGCSLLLHSGELTRITSSATWSKQELTLLLFDRLLLLCKRESGLLKKGTKIVYSLKSRLPMDEVEMEEVAAVEAPSEEGTNSTSDTTSTNSNTTSSPIQLPKNAFKFFYRRKAKWYIFQAKSPAERQKWVAAFAEQRQRVRDDDAAGFSVTERDKRCAQLAHQNHLKPKRPPPRARRPYYAKGKKPDTVIAEIPLASIDFDRNRAGSLPSYIFAATDGGAGRNQQSILNGLKHGRQSTMHAKKSSGGSGWFQLGSNKGKSRLKRNLK